MAVCWNNGQHRDTLLIVGKNLAQIYDWIPSHGKIRKGCVFISVKIGVTFTSLELLT